MAEAAEAVKEEAGTEEVAEATGNGAIPEVETGVATDQEVKDAVDVEMIAETAVVVEMIAENAAVVEETDPRRAKLKTELLSVEEGLIQVQQ